MAENKDKKMWLFVGGAMVIAALIIIIRKITVPTKAAATTTMTAAQKAAFANASKATATTVAKPAATATTPKAPATAKVVSMFNPANFDIGDDVWAKGDGVQVLAFINDKLTYITYNDGDYLGTFDGSTNLNGADFAWIYTDTGVPDSDHWIVPLTQIYN